MEKRYVGTTEDRINKWMRMCLQWQFDIRMGVERKANHYYSEYHVGKYPKKYFEDLGDIIIDRNNVINKMNQISEYRMKRDRSVGKKTNKVLIVQTSNLLDVHRKPFKINGDTIVKYVERAKNDE